MKKVKTPYLFAGCLGDINRKAICALEEQEKLIARGASLSIACGHPEWKNTCCVCGEKEISIYEKVCLPCKLK